MNEVVTIDAESVEQSKPRNAPALVAGARPRAIVPTDLDQVWRFAQMVAKSGMAPKDMNKPEAITVSIMHGLEVGLTPLMALQRIAVINGRPSIWGDAAIGLVRASGLCEFVFETVSGEGDRMVALCRTKRKGEKEPTERTFSVAQAKQAGLWGKSGPWQQYPHRMLQMRARAFALRDAYADVLGGLYIAEELEEGHEAMVDVTPPKPLPSEPSKEQEPTRSNLRPLPPPARSSSLASPPETEQPAPAPEASETKPVHGAGTDPLDIPPALDRRPKKDADPLALPDPKGDPEVFVKAVERAVASFKPEQREEAVAWFNDNVVSVMPDLMPPDQAALSRLFMERLS